MQLTREIIVVAPELYKELARKVTHEISKLSGCNGACWTIKQYEDNEFQLGGRRHVILIGNPSENRITHDFLSAISNLKNRGGACYGFDGAKAVIFGEGILEQQKIFKEVHEKSVAIVSQAGATSTLGACVAAASVALTPLGWTALPIVGAFKMFKRKRTEKQLRKEQTKSALTFFLAEHFDEWVGLRKPEQDK